MALDGDGGRQAEGEGELWAVPFLFVGGTLAAPFVAFCNGVNCDANHLGCEHGDWHLCDQVVRPREMIYLGDFAR